MTSDFVSEVDRKFYSNNLLTNDDWGSTVMDLNEFLDMDVINELSDNFPTDFHDNLLQDYSDSSDSGISSVLPDNVFKQNFDGEVKHEPLSPSVSMSSESSDSQICMDIIKESPPLSPLLSQDSGACSPLLLSAQSSPLNSQDLTMINQDLLKDSPPSSPFSQQSSPQSYVYVDDISNSAMNTVIQPQPKIHTILNSKVKIQPKPVSSANTPTSQPKPITAQSNQKTVVITPEEFNKLKAEGVIKFPQHNSTQRPLQIISPAPIITPTIQADTEIKAIKRQQRMIKNRESASLSRKRKKEYLQGLEDTLNQFNDQNRKLQEENQILKRKLMSLQEENDKLKKTAGVSPAKKMCLMAVFVMLSLNLVSLNDYIVRPNSRLDLPIVHKGRQLMSVKEEYSVSSYVPDFSLAGLKKLMDDNPIDGLDNKTLYQMYTCPSLFNKTESIRLADQLSGWMQSHELIKKKSASKDKKSSTQKKKKPLSTLQKAMRGKFDHHRYNEKRHFDHSYQVQLFDSGDGNIWKSIPRRNDTFYVLSFNEDYFLVPATAHNKTMRPRMSLVMPAVGLNETMRPPPGNVGMMQIDCEVLNTQLIHVHKSSLPHNQKNGTYYKESYHP